MNSLVKTNQFSLILPLSIFNPLIFSKNIIHFNYSEQKNNIDISQKKFLKDSLILVDEKDNNIGSISKIDAHLKSKKNLFPHRAFSILLFDENNKLLLQQRSFKKITFPLLWTNTCCSHPLNIPSENSPKNITNSLVKRLQFELGLKVNKNIFKLFDKILYRAPSNKIFEEFELDYLFMGKIKNYNEQKMKKIMNKDEVENVVFKSIDDIMEKMEDYPDKFTPWFKIMMKTRGKLMKDILNGKNKNYFFDGKIKNYIV